MSYVTLSGKKYINTIYSFTLDNIKIVFLGALGEGEISKEALEAINKIASDYEKYQSKISNPDLREVTDMYLEVFDVNEH